MTKPSDKSERLVYSTDQGRMCPACEQPMTTCACGRNENSLVGDGKVRVTRSTKGRKGKGVTVVSGLPLTAADLEKLGKELRKKCGTGGTVKNGCIEIQGEHREFLVAELRKRGWDAK